MIRMYQNWGFEVTLACFSWKGIQAHDWEYERQSCLKMQQEGKLTLVNCHIDPTIPVQIQSAPKIKKPCGCKDKKELK